MAVLLLPGSPDGDSVLSAAGGDDTFTYDAGVSGTDHALLVAVVYETNTGPNDVTDVTYDGVALTHKLTVVTGGTGFTENIEFWVLASPSTGSNNLVITSTQSGRDLGFVAAVWSGVDQTNITSATAELSGQFGASHTDITSDEDNSMLVGAVVISRADFTSSGPRPNNTLLVTETSASGNAGFNLYLTERGPESSAGTFDCGMENNSVETNVGIIELLEAVAGGGVTVALTGQSSTSGQGAVTITAGATFALAGQSATAGQGSITVLTAAGVDVILDGQASTAGQGTVTATGAANLVLGGLGAVSAQGVLTVAAGGSITVALAGLEATGGQGVLTVTGEASLSLTGLEATAGQGALSVDIGTIIALTGLSATTQIGTIVVVSANIISLAGLGSVAGQGVITVTSGDVWTIQPDNSTEWTEQTNSTTTWTIQ